MGFHAGSFHDDQPIIYGGLSNPFFVYILFKKSFKSRNACSAVRKDQLCIIYELAVFRHVKDHVSLDLSPQIDSVIQISLTYHGSVYGPHRGACNDVYFYSEVNQRLPDTGFISAAGTSAAEDQSSFRFLSVRHARPP